MEQGDPLILFHFRTACAIINRFWQKRWHILFDPKLSRTTLNEFNLPAKCEFMIRSLRGHEYRRNITVCAWTTYREFYQVLPETNTALTNIYSTQPVKGEVRAICRFWVFDGNGLLGHRLIDSRWFEKNPPTESGWKRRSKKTPTYRYFARKWSWRNMCFQIRAISSRLWFTYIFAFDSGSLSIAGGWRKCGTLLIFLSNCSTCVPVAAPGRTGSPGKRICRGTLSQKTRNWSIWQTAHCYVDTEGPSLRKSLLWKVGLHVQYEDQRVFVCAKPSLFS